MQHADAAVLLGVSVLVVEDEALLALTLEDLLADAGATIVGPAMNHGAALRLIESAQVIDVALLDVNLGGHPVYPVASLLAERGVPIVFATGYGKEGLCDEWRRHMVVRKPYDGNDIVGALRSVLPPR